MSRLLRFFSFLLSHMKQDVKFIQLQIKHSQNKIKTFQSHTSYKRKGHQAKTL